MQQAPQIQIAARTVESDQGLWPAVSVNRFQVVRCVVARGDRAAGIRHGNGSRLLRLIVCGRAQSSFIANRRYAADGKKVKANGSSVVTRGGVKSLSRTTTQST